MNLAVLALVLALFVESGNGGVPIWADWRPEGELAIRLVSVAEQVTLSGWFHVVWNGGAQYVLIDDQGRWARLLLDETLVVSFGGPRKLNRLRVIIVGETVPDAGVIRVLSIQPE